VSTEARALLRRLLRDKGAIEVTPDIAGIVTELDQAGLVAVYRGHVVARGVKSC
jgi:hypothetical protein